MSGRHEPGSRSSLYVSVTTAVLRAGLVVVAVVLGVFVLTRAFPEGGTEAQTETPVSPTASPTGVTVSPTALPTTSPGATQPPSSPAVSLQGVGIQVLNGTNVDQLAKNTSVDLEQEFGVETIAVGNAARTYPITTLFFRPDSEAIAQTLADAKFPGAKLEPAENNLEPEIQVTVVLGEDFAEQA